MKFLKKNCGGTRPTLYGIVYGTVVVVATCSCSLCSLIIRFDGPVGHKHVSATRNRIHEVVLQGKPKRQQQNQHLQMAKLLSFVGVGRRNTLQFFL